MTKKLSALGLILGLISGLMIIFHATSWASPEQSSEKSFREKKNRSKNKNTLRAYQYDKKKKWRKRIHKEPEGATLPAANP